MVIPNSPLVTHCTNLVRSVRLCFDPQFRQQQQSGQSAETPLEGQQLEEVAQLVQDSYLGLCRLITQEQNVEVLNFVLREIVHSILSVPNLPAFLGAKFSLLAGGALEQDENVHLDDIDPFLNFLDHLVGENLDLESLEMVVPAVAALCSQAGDPAFLKLRDLLAQKSTQIRGKSQKTRFLYMLSNMLIDEEIVVFVPTEFRKLSPDSFEIPQIKAFRFRISRLSDNGTLFILLTHYLWTHFPATPFFHPGRNPVTPEMVSVITGEAKTQICSKDFSNPVFFSCWNVFNGSLRVNPFSMEHYIWQEGAPVDIAPFKGRRIIVVTPPIYLRSFNVIRTFGPLRSSCELIGQMAEDETQALIQDILANSGQQSALRTEAETFLEAHHGLLKRTFPNTISNLM